MLPHHMTWGVAMDFPAYYSRKLPEAGKSGTEVLYRGRNSRHELGVQSPGATRTDNALQHCRPYEPGPYVYMSAQ